MGNIILILCLVLKGFITCDTFSQEIIIKKMKDFLTERDLPNPSGFEPTILITELITYEFLVDNLCGVYRFTYFSAHSTTYIALIDSKREELVLLDLSDLPNAMNQILEFLDKSECGFTDQQKFEYIEKTMDIFNRNLKRIRQFSIPEPPR